MPPTVSEFAEVNGVGKAKLKLFPSLFLRVLNSTSEGPDKQHQCSIFAFMSVNW